MGSPAHVRRAERRAYFSASGRLLIFQRQGPAEQCDQMYVMGVDGGRPHRVSSRRGRTTCGYLYDCDLRIFYASTEHAGGDCPPRPDWVMNVDGSDQHQVTHLPGASFAPYFHPDGRRIIFSSNYKSPESRDFDLYLVNADGTGLEQVTTAPGFDAFPMFSPDGTHLVWASNRHGTAPHETNIFLAEWVERP